MHIRSDTFNLSWLLNFVCVCVWLLLILYLSLSCFFLLFEKHIFQKLLLKEQRAVLLLYTILFLGEDFNCVGDLAIYIQSFQVVFRLHKASSPAGFLLSHAYGVLCWDNFRQQAVQSQLAGLSTTLLGFLYPLQHGLMVDTVYNPQE